MGTLETGTDIRTLVGRLRRESAADHGVPDAAAARAAAITIRRMAGLADSRTRYDERRVTAYYWGVLRREALRDVSPGGSLRDRYFVAALADDLSAGGHAPESIFEELTRQFGAKVGTDVLERFRPRAVGQDLGSAYR